MLQGVTVTNGYAADGGGIHCGPSSPLIVNCRLASNHADLFGGAVLCWSGAGPQFVDCVFEDNVALLGGAVYIDCGLSAPQFTACTFAGNTATEGGGAISI